MMKLKFYIYLVIASIAVLFTACTPDEFELGAKDVTTDDLVEGLAFTITHDANNPNIVYLESKMGSSYTALWEHPQGRSQASKVTLKIPFDGVYTVRFGVQTRGGAVYGEPVTFTINDFYAGFVDNELWTLISGGVGKSKTWYLDLDAEGVSRYFSGPLYFYGTDDGWETITNGTAAPEGSDSWNWCPDYAGNTWLMTAADFGTMTFDLIGGANVVVEHKTISSRGTEKGIYMLDVDNHTMRMTDASPLHDSNREGVVVDWGNIKILSLTESTMQLGMLRDAVLSGEGACLLVYNYISKDYKDNWTPGEKHEPEPTLPTNWQTDISQTVTTSIKWVLSPETPFNWANLDGSLMNTAWVSPETYDSWTGFDASIPATYANFSLTMDSKDNSLIYVDKDGNEQIGSYTLDEKGFYTFTGATPSFTICGGWVNLNTSANNQWRITSIEKNSSGKITGMWVGVRDAVKPEYMVYHLIPQAGSSSDGNNGTEISFDASKIVYGDIEGNGKLRIEIYNAYGSTSSNPPVDPSALVFYNSLEITFTLSGISLIAGAPASYDASMYFANVDWYPSGNGPNVTVTGDGTYTVSFSGTSSSNANVVVVDIVNLAANIADMNSVKAIVKKIVIK